MQQEEEENHDHCRLGDEIFLELERYPIEAVFTGQYRTHQQHVTEHEQRKQQPAAATGQLVNDLATGLCQRSGLSIIAGNGSRPFASALSRAAIL
jgi:hypothetical protein